VEGAIASLNYAGSFVAMQLLGFTLATKQPSMTAAALAHALRERGADLDELVSQIARICRSQLAAAIGNVGGVIPAAIGFHLLYLRLAGHPFLDEKAAEYTLHSLHPSQTGTIYFAFLTGIFLWLSSLGAGWLENWSAYRRLPEAIAQKRPRAIMGWLGRKLAHHVAGFGGNVTLGILLGMMPVIGKFLGVPFEVRHVTLSTGGLTLAVCSLGASAFEHPGFWAAVLGIGIILTLNFGVSFALALGVAVRARGVEHAGLRLLRAVLARFFRSPAEFFFPPSQ
jgi:site-specific recombinase